MNLAKTIDELVASSPYAFSIVLEAKARTLATLTRKYRREMTLEQLIEHVSAFITDQWKKEKSA